MAKVKIILDALKESFKNLTNILLVIIIFLAFYASLGLNLYKGILEQRCRSSPRPESPDRWKIHPDTEYLCGSKLCPPETSCGNGFLMGVPFDMSEIYSDTFNYGMSRFDSIFQSLVTMFEILIGEGWIDIMYIVSHSV